MFYQDGHGQTYGVTDDQVYFLATDGLRFEALGKTKREFFMWFSTQPFSSHETLVPLVPAV